MTTSRQVTGGLAASPVATGAPSARSAANVEAADNKCSGWKEIHITGGAAKYMECTKKVDGKSYASGAFYF
ncbi:hypothetical protein ACWEWI_24170 [Streptomyces sp. NPDC003753]